MNAAAKSMADADPSQMLNEAVTHQQAGRWDRADTLLRQILEADPGNIPALSNLGVLSAARGNFVDAEFWYRQVLSVTPDDTDVLANLGNLLFAREETGEAERAFRQALGHDPDHMAANLGLGSVLVESDKIEEAIPFYERGSKSPGAANADALEARAKLAAMQLVVGDAESARGTAESILAQAPQHFEALCVLGNVHAEAGEASLAEQQYRAAAGIRPATATPLKHLGILYDEQGQKEEATAAFTQAVEADPEDAAMLREFGSHLLGRGLANEALTTLEASWRLNPRDLATATRLANFHAEGGRDEDALEFLRAAHSICPEVPDMGLAVALCLLRLGRHLDALEVLQPLSIQNPNLSAAQTLIGQIAYSLGRYSEALAALRAAVTLDPDALTLRIAIAHAEREAGSTQAAVDHANYVLATEPHHKAANLVKAQALSDLTRYEEAMDVVVEAMDHVPSGDVDTLLVLAEVCERAGQRDKAATAYELILKHRPGDPFVLARLVELKLTLCDWSGYQKFIADLVADVGRRITAGDSLPIDVHDLQNLPVSYEFLASAARCKAAGIIREAEPARARCDFTFDGRLSEWRAGSGRRKIRLGYALPYTWFHSFPALMKEIIERHDRDRFEVFGYSLMPSKGGEFEIRYRAQFDQFQDLPHGSPEAAARIIHRDEIDILVDVAGHSSINSQAIAALRPAPVAAHVLGYAMTSGADYIDYLITDPVYMPAEFAATGNEAVVYMPETHIAAADPMVSEAKVTRSEFGLPEEGFVFCNFNQPFKFGPVMFRLWMNMLRRVRGSVLWLGNWDASTRANLRGEVEAHGVDAERLVFSKVVDQDVHLGRLRLADLALDTYPHGGGATTLDALWVGVPVLTYAGDTPASLAGDSILQTLGMPELITRTFEDYEGEAVALALEPQRLAQLKDRLTSQLGSSPVFDRDRYVRHLDRCFELIWEQTVAGERDTIIVPALD